MGDSDNPPTPLPEIERAAWLKTAVNPHVGARVVCCIAPRVYRTAVVLEAHPDNDGRVMLKPDWLPWDKDVVPWRDGVATCRDGWVRYDYYQSPGTWRWPDEVYEAAKEQP